MLELAVVKIGYSRKSDMRMGSHVDSVSGQKLSRPHLVDEDEGANHLPRRRRQRAAHFETTKVAGPRDYLRFRSHRARRLAGNAALDLGSSSCRGPFSRASIDRSLASTARSIEGLFERRGQRIVTGVEDEDREQLCRLGLARVAADQMGCARLFRPALASLIDACLSVIHLGLIEPEIT